MRGFAHPAGFAAARRCLRFLVFTGSITRSASRRYLIYSEADFEVFRPEGPLLRAKFHPHRCNNKGVGPPKQTIIFLPFDFYLLSSFFPRLISVVGDSRSTILPHMVWPYCKFRMHVWNVLHAARWKYRTQKISILAPSHNFVGLYLHSWGMYWHSEKKLVKHRYLLHMSS